jgi:hypothetical protein
MATNRADTLDPALLRPGRLDRKIEFPLPDRRQKRLVFQVGGGAAQAGGRAGPQRQKRCGAARGPRAAARPLSTPRPNPTPLALIATPPPADLPLPTTPPPPPHPRCAPPR